MAYIRSAGLTHPGIAACLLCCLPAPAWAVDEVPPRPMRSAVVSAARELLFDFDIPAQPLEGALYRYGDISRQPALFPSSMIAGLTSSAVHGSYSAETALRLLLDGTGLTMEKAASAGGDIFLLKKIRADKADFPAADRELDGYPALIQTRILQALCADARIAPGSYRSLFSVQVDAEGNVGDARLIDSTGNSRRDAVLLAVLRQVRIGMPPPSNAMRQPFTMALAEAAVADSPCAGQSGGRRP